MCVGDMGWEWDKVCLSLHSKKVAQIIVFLGMIRNAVNCLAKYSFPEFVGMKIVLHYFYNYM